MCLHAQMVLADFQILPLNGPSWVLRGLRCRFSTPWMVVIHFWLVNATCQMQSPPSILAPARRLSDVFAIRCHKQNPSKLLWMLLDSLHRTLSLEGRKCFRPCFWTQFHQGYIGPFSIYSSRVQVRAVAVQAQKRSQSVESTFLICHAALPETWQIFANLLWRRNRNGVCLPTRLARTLK